MHYLIDGYNLLFRLLKKKGSLEKVRQELITELNDLVSELKMQVTLVFDGAQEHLLPLSRGHYDALEIIYTHKEQTADEFILEYLNLARSPGQFTIVTNDRELSGKSHQLGAKILNIDAFVNALQKKKKKKKVRESNPEIHFRDSTPEIARLLIVFEKKLLEEMDL